MKQFILLSTILFSLAAVAGGKTTDISKTGLEAKALNGDYYIGSVEEKALKAVSGGMPEECKNTTEPNSSGLEFSKAVYKVKGVIKHVDGDYVIIPSDDKTLKFAPDYMPEEYKKSGLEVTLDGEVGKPSDGLTPLVIHKIWVAYELKEKFKLVHKNYDLN